jgi:cystathionine beta-lyase family protein involved in aluminum resistance
MNFKAYLLVVALTAQAFACSGSADCIEAAYNTGVSNGTINLTTASGAVAGSASLALAQLQEAVKKADDIKGIEDDCTDNLKNYNKVAKAEALFLYRSIDSTSKLDDIKRIHSDLLSVLIQQNILYSEARSMSLREIFNSQIENEFQKGN